MSIITTPPVGFPDDQQSAQWQSQAFLNDSSAYTAGVTKTFGPFNVANWKATQFQFTGSIGRRWVQVSWSSDSAGLIGTGYKFFVCNNALQANPTLINLGPYMFVEVTNFLNNDTIHSIACGTNVDKPAWNPNSAIPMLAAQPANVGAGSTTKVEANYAYAGPAHYMVESAATSWQVQIIATDQSANTYIVHESGTVASGTAVADNKVIIIPPLQITANLINHDAGAKNIYCALYPDLFH